MQQETNHLPMIPVERMDDLHHLDIVESADLVLFMAGNQFMVMPEMVQAFQDTYPDIRRIFYETLPPGLELKQILNKGAVFGDRILSFQPDIYTSVNLQAMHTLEKAGLIEPGAYRLYLHNRLALMVPEGNPANIKTVSDLGKNEMRISQPDPANEDIAYHILDMYRQAGGQELVDRIMTEKRAQGTTVMTVVHHRETPLGLTKRSVENTDSFPMRRVVRRGIKSLSFLVQKDLA